MQNIQTFESISKRVLFAFRLSFSEFSPAESETVSPESQRMLYDILNDIQNNLYNNPYLLALPADPDDSYPWYLCNNQRPELSAVYTTVFKTLYDFYLFLYTMSRDGELSENNISITKQQLKAKKASYKNTYEDVLNTVGIDVTVSKEGVTLSHMNGNDVFAAFKLLGNRCSRTLFEIPEAWRDSASLQSNLFFFAACCYKCEALYILNRIDELYGMNGLLLRLKASCEEEGYTFAIRTVIAQNEIGMSIDMKYGIGGFQIVYNARKTQKVGFGTLNGIGEKAMLEDFNNLDHDMQDHFISICRSCNGCLGCTKGGKNKLFTVKVVYKGENYNLCPMFPNHTWETMDEALVDRLMKYHELQLKYTKNGK